MNVKALTDQEVLTKKAAAITAEERARVRFDKNNSVANGQRYQKAREKAGALRNEARVRAIS